MSSTNNTSTVFAAAGAAAAGVNDHWPAIVASSVFIAFTLIAQYFFKVDPLAGIPVVGQGGKASRRRQFVKQGGAWKLHHEGYQKFKDGLFRIITARETESIIISPKFLGELRKLPDDVLSFNASVTESLQSKYTGVKADLPHVTETVKTSLTPALPRLNPEIHSEVVDSMRLELPQSSTWTDINLNSKLLRIVAMASGRIFVGPELCRDEGYLDAAINYTIDLMIAVHVVAFMPVWLRPILGPIIPPVRKVHRRVKEADEFLRPVVTARREAEKLPGYKKPDDMLQWIMNSQDKFGVKDDKELAFNQLGVSFAAIHTTTMTTTNSLYTLAAMPEIAPMLREDVQQALAASDGVFTSLAMQNMKKLDSFLREVLRYYPISTTSFQRKVLKPFTLSNGTTIPAGIIIEIPAAGVSGDPSIFPDPEVFDALRFYKLRQSKSKAESGAKAAETVANSQFVSVSASSLTFGYGKHACPGRFFAANEIKMILATILLHYDIKLPDGVTERYPNLEMGAQSLPDPKKLISIRKRENVAP
ncbi:unnamed protein product [Clonostachys rosea f. rosea IK726]|uniref:Uncharacterized protein n=3 Tax=Bionectria ochroleuca TaxID=29856 RepID=A0A0B7KFJ4_BIOOC|nr:unnamed protein product [Clonostachys rosea f. rosea IK726]